MGFGQQSGHTPWALLGPQADTRPLGFIKMGGPRAGEEDHASSPPTRRALPMGGVSLELSGQGPPHCA